MGAEMGRWAVIGGSGLLTPAATLAASVLAGSEPPLALPPLVSPGSTSPFFFQGWGLTQGLDGELHPQLSASALLFFI